MDIETLQTLLAIVAGGVVIPVVGMLKMTKITLFVRPEFLKFGLLALTAWGLIAWLYPDVPTDIKQIIDLALQATGAGTILYGAKKAVTK